MRGPEDLTASELERCGLAAIQRHPRSGEAVTKIFCLHCGRQVSADRRADDPDGWWACARGCNTTYSSQAPPPMVRPRP